MKVDWCTGSLGALQREWWQRQKKKTYCELYERLDTKERERELIGRMELERTCSRFR